MPKMRNFKTGARALPLARAASKPDQSVMAICASFSTKEMWMRAPGVILRVNPFKWQTASLSNGPPLELQATVQECRFTPWPTQPGGPLVNERGEFVGMYWGGAPQTEHLAIDASEVRTLLRHPDVAALLAGGGSKKEKPEGPNRPAKPARGTTAAGNRRQPTKEQTAALRLVGRPTGVTADFLHQRKKENDAQRAATNNLRLEHFKKIIRQLEQRGMEHVGEVAARSAGPLQSRFIDVKVRGSLNVSKIHEAAGPEDATETVEYGVRVPEGQPRTTKPITWYRYGWLYLGVSNDIVRIVRVDCEFKPTPVAPQSEPTSVPDEPEPAPAAIQAEPEKPRTWTAGNHTTEATLVAVDGPNVTLRRTNGSEVTLRRDLLSKEDQEYIQNSPLGRSK
jgi:hypothetical protein